MIGTRLALPKSGPSTLPIAASMPKKYIPAYILELLLAVTVWVFTASILLETTPWFGVTLVTITRLDMVARRRRLFGQSCKVSSMEQGFVVYPMHLNLLTQYVYQKVLLRSVLVAHIGAVI